MKGTGMRLVGMFLLLTGWCILIASLVMFGPVVSRSLFLAVGLGVQVLGLVLAFRAEPRWKGGAR